MDVGFEPTTQKPMLLTARRNMMRQRGAPFFVRLFFLFAHEELYKAIPRWASEGVLPLSRQIG